MNLLTEFYQQALFVWEKGGGLMFALLLLSLYLYFLGFELWLRMKSVIPRDLQSIPREKWAGFQGGGRVDQVMRHCLVDHQNRDETRKRFQQIRQSEAAYLNRRLRFLFVLASSAPLIGLLGTVAGMLRTFAGLSMEEGYKMDVVASGISQALVTTQAGLLIAIPALAFLHLLNRKKKDWLRCLNRMESISIRQISPSPIKFG
ncbi:MAG: MotA/TolQ/ExbB proton channel family protein [Opitutales bacterium]|jgi:biopolymer transport protein ExbB|tara:strand:+ start:86 stop:694 length:609 start_codon:yes stop_codon:yes gene_type:complete